MRKIYMHIRRAVVDFNKSLSHKERLDVRKEQPVFNFDYVKKDF
jgi:hypothetical protein